MRYRNQTTQPPADNTYLEWLRYLVQSSDTAAGELPFLVGLWNACLIRKGLTEPQQAALQPYIDEANLFLQAHVYPPKTDESEQSDFDRTNVVDLIDRRGK